MNERCNGCGRKDLVTTAFECTWPDGHTTIERHCDNCRRTWHRQLGLLGATLTLVDGNESGDESKEDAAASNRGADGDDTPVHLTLESNKRRDIKPS